MPRKPAAPGPDADADRLAYFLDSRVSDLLALAALNGEVTKGVEVPAGLRERVRAAAMVWAVEMLADLKRAKS